MKKYAIVFLSLVISIFFCRAVSAEEWDLKTCLDIGLKQNPTIRAAQKGIDGAQARVKQSQSTYYPILFGEVDYTRYNTQSSLNGSSLNLGDADLTTYFLGLSQNIYDLDAGNIKSKPSRRI